MLIAVTGQIGAGKSSVVRRLKEFGCRVVDADRVGKQATGSAACLKRLKKIFGPEIQSAGGRLRPAKLAQVVFSDKSGKAVATLNCIVRPALVAALRREIDEALGRKPNRPVVLDAALLPDWDHGLDIDLTILVTATRENRFRRLTGRGMSAEQAKARTRAQRPLKDYRRIADSNITNNGSLSELRVKVDRLWDRRIAPLLQRHD